MSDRRASSSGSNRLSELLLLLPFRPLVLVLALVTPPSPLASLCECVCVCVFSFFIFSFCVCVCAHMRIVSAGSGLGWLARDRAFARLLTLQMQCRRAITNHACATCIVVLCTVLTFAPASPTTGPGLPPHPRSPRTRQRTGAGWLPRSAWKECTRIVGQGLAQW